MKTKNTTWEEEFEKHWNSDWEVNDFVVYVDMDCVKDFIKSLILKEREEGREEGRQDIIKLYKLETK